MTNLADIGRVIEAWMADGPTTMPDRVIDVVAARIAVQPQRRTWRLQGRPFMTTPIKLAAGLAAVLIVAVVAWQMLPGRGGTGGLLTPTPRPTSSASAATPAMTPVASELPDPLVGTWTSAASTCAQQNAAIQRAGITAEQLGLVGWDAATCAGMVHGSVQEIRFQPGLPGLPASADGRLLQLSDGEVRWDGHYVIVDADTFVAGGGGNGSGEPYITYGFRIDGDQLVIDMVSNEIQGVSEAMLWADIIAQTVTYESGPFTRQ